MEIVKKVFSKLKNISKTKLLAAVFVLIILFCWKRYHAPGQLFSFSTNWSCVERADETVHDDEMTGVFKNGDNVHVLKNYYDCNPIQRGDIVLLKSAPSSIRVVRALPGDQVEGLGYPQDKSFVIRVNGEFLSVTKEKTPQRFGYSLFYNSNSDEVFPMFRQSPFKLDKDQYMVFSARDPGSNDSSKFGPLSLQQIAGRVVP